MLIRIVRMTFHPEKVEEFLAIFHASKHKIAAMPGCHGVELLQDYHQANIYHTYSTWDSDDALNQYRQSTLFGMVWKPTKALFSAPAQAFSMKKG
ncbi:antibiotic biosynthesis monooxygenase [Nibribacter ruber]|uniref:Antibiotic biosynthesis monooxygenase n=1 Tax=Nibribacter ruber TaxID=2698458 RepID=A0A6P1NXK0_9BACT|nr:antibiotic biosynthesis monooxygenase family protein [Nibribacter ruber]QHL86919.1 antibiotic biosynthesis monooxygenase [Nibribacter ruber]